MRSQPLTAQVSLKDGRQLEVRVSVLAERPKLVLIGKSIDPAASPIHLDSADDLPVNARLHFRLKSEKPGAFGKAEKVEVASDDGFYHAELSLENGGLMRQNAHTVMATLEIERMPLPPPSVRCAFVRFPKKVLAVTGSRWRPWCVCRS